MRVDTWAMTFKRGDGSMRYDLRDHGLVVVDEYGWPDGAYRFIVGARTGPWAAARILSIKTIMAGKYGTLVSLKPVDRRLKLRRWRLRETRFSWRPRVHRCRNGCTDLTIGWWTWYNEPETEAELL